MWNKLIQWLESLQIPCTFQKYFGIECPGCGMQRAFIELLKGNLSDSVLLYPALIPMLSTLLMLIIHFNFQFKWSGKAIKILFTLSVVLILIPYLYKTFF